MRLKKQKIFLIGFFFILLVIAILPFFSAQAGVIPCATAENPRPCTICDMIVGVKNIIIFGLDILIVVSIVAIFIAGIMYIISAGSEESMTRAKEFLGTTLKGFAIVLMSWFIINIVMWVLSVNLPKSIQKVNWYTFTCNTSSSSIGPTSAESGEPTPSGYTFDPKIEMQMPDASDLLKSLLNCMQPKLPDADAKKISSISDSAGMDNCVNSWSRPPCAHIQNSCHYGGRSCRGRSYAADFGNEQYADQIISAATSCGGKALNEGNHVHVSIGDCGCDEGI